MAMEMSTDRAICYRCGKMYSRKKGFFPVSYAVSHKGVGYIPICKECIDTMYNSYLAQCHNAKDAVRQMCRKLDLYWSENLYELVQKKSTTQSMMTQYIVKTNSISYAGKSYDDTLSEEGTLWNFYLEAPKDDDDYDSSSCTQSTAQNTDNNSQDSRDIEIPQDIVAYWGSGYSNEMYEKLEQRRKYYLSQYPDTFLNEDGQSNIANDIYLRQLCNLEVSIASDSAAGKSIEKSVNTVNTIMGSLNLKPTQSKNAEKDSELESTPLGVWLWRYENKRPLPSEDELDDSVKDVYGIKKYIFTWMGHVFKLAGKKNAFAKLYEDEIARLRVERPEYDGDDESLVVDFYSDDNSGGETDGNTEQV